MPLRSSSTACNSSSFIHRSYPPTPPDQRNLFINYYKHRNSDATADEAGVPNFRGPLPPIERAAYQPSILRQPRIPCNEEAGTNSPQTATCMIRHLILRKLTRILPHPSPRRSQGTMRSDRGLKRPGACHTDWDPARYKRGWERACQVFGCDLLECDEARVG